MGSPPKLVLATCAVVWTLAGATVAHASLPSGAAAGTITRSAPGSSAPKAPGSSTVKARGSSTVKASGSTTTTTADPEAPIPIAPSDTPPVGRRLSPNEVLEIAEALPKMRAVRVRYRGSYGGAYLKGPSRWQVSYFSKQGKEIGQVIIADSTGHVLEQWTGFQIAWSMARGYPGAFGRHVNALYIWIPLCVLFFVPFFDRRRPLRLLHLDLLVLLSFSVSLAFFNHARIYASTPLVYPPLVYLLVRMLVLARVGRRSRAATDTSVDVSSSNGTGGSAQAGESPPREAGGARLRMLVPPSVLAVGIVFLLGFRIGLNVTDSNVIDVGYAGVIGAQRITEGKPLYGSYPSDNEHGDTYGPVNYETYIPFQQLFGWSGRWDDLPAAHGAAILFDLLAVALLFLLGRRVRGPGLGIVLAYAWVSFPFTLYALESNSNDSLVAVLVLAALLAAGSRRVTQGRRQVRVGVLAALAALTKFAPAALAPLFCTEGLVGLSWPRRARAIFVFSLAFVAAAAVVFVPALAHDSLHTVYERTLAYQADRESPFSIWGLHPGLVPLQRVVQGVALALAVTVAFVPRRRDLVGLAACAAAVLIAVQLGIDHWFYLYIPWFFGLVVLALLGQLIPRDQAPPAAASAPARSSQLATA